MKYCVSFFVCVFVFACSPESSSLNESSSGLKSVADEHLFTTPLYINDDLISDALIQLRKQTFHFRMNNFSVVMDGKLLGTRGLTHGSRICSESDYIMIYSAAPRDSVDDKNAGKLVASKRDADIGAVKIFRKSLFSKDIKKIEFYKTDFATRAWTMSPIQKPVGLTSEVGSDIPDNVWNVLNRCPKTSPGVLHLKPKPE